MLYIIHRHKIHEQSIFSRPFIFAFNSTIDSLYLIDWGKLFQSRHALNNKTNYKIHSNLRIFPYSEIIIESTTFKLMRGSLRLKKNDQPLNLMF